MRRHFGVRAGLACIGAAFVAPSLPTLADEVPVIALAIQDHKFTPELVKIPAKTKVKLLVANKDAAAEEFESYELNREKLIPPGTEGVVFIGPLNPGTYRFFGDFHQNTAQGQIVVQ
jgi:plastocyanin